MYKREVIGGGKSFVPLRPPFSLALACGTAKNFLASSPSDVANEHSIAQ